MKPVRTPRGGTVMVLPQCVELRLGHTPRLKKCERCRRWFIDFTFIGTLCQGGECSFQMMEMGVEP